MVAAVGFFLHDDSTADDNDASSDSEVCGGVVWVIRHVTKDSIYVHMSIIVSFSLYAICTMQLCADC